MVIAENSNNIHGGCYCGTVRFLIAAKSQPLMAGYCHCRDCRQAHSAPIYQYVYIERQNFQIAEGAELLNWYTRDERKRDNFKRYFCMSCGSKTHNYLKTFDGTSKVELYGTFPSLFDDQETATNDVWSPQKHVQCAESIMNLNHIQDNLPRS